MKKKNNTIPEIVIPKDYEIDEILDMDEDVIALRKYYCVFNGDVIRYSRTREARNRSERKEQPRRRSFAVLER